MEEEEPVTPMGRLCLLPEHNHIIHCALQLENPIDINALKHEISNSIMVKIPRFSCIMTLDPYGGLEHWKRVHIDLDDHVIVHPNYNNTDDENGMSSDDDVINSYLGEMAISSPMRMDKPLWELHIMHAQNCIIMRVHHAICDGMSLMSLLSTMGTSPKPVHNNNTNINGNNSNKSSNVDESKQTIKNNEYDNKGIWKSMVSIWYTMVYGLIFIVRCLWVKDKGRVISGFMGLEFWPRKVANARFKISDMKTIKKAIPNATVHDVLCGILWCGLTRYLNIQYSTDLQDGVQITGMCPYNLRKQWGVQDDVCSMLTKNKMTAWGNKFSVILLPFIYKKRELDPLAYVKLAKDMMDKKKQSMEALLSYNIVSLGSALFGAKVAGFFYYNLFCNTSFMISNMAGPSKLVYIGENPVTSVRVSSSSFPQAMTMHMVSYGEWANLQVQVAQNVIPNPKILAKCFEDALLDMMKQASKYTIIKA